MLDLAVVLVVLLLVYEAARGKGALLLASWLLIIPLKQFLVTESFLFGRVDPVLILFVITLAAVILALSRQGWRSEFRRFENIFLIHFLLALLSLSSLCWTDAWDYGSSKTLRFLCLNSILLFSPVLLLHSRQDWRRLLVVNAFCMLLIYGKIAMFPQYDLLKGGSKPFRAGFAFGAEAAPAGASLAAAYLTSLVISRSSIVWRFLQGILVLLILYGAVVTGTRAILWGALVTIVTVIVAKVITRKGLSSHPLLIGIILLFLVLFAFSDHIPQVQRVTRLGTDDSISARHEHWSKAWGAFCSHPVLGLGSGGYAIYALGSDERFFPHNIFLECLAELGIVGFLLLVSLIGAFSHYVIRRTTAEGGLRSCPDEALVVVAATCGVFLQTMVTDDISDNRSFWLLMGLAISATSNHFRVTIRHFSAIGSFPPLPAIK